MLLDVNPVYGHSLHLKERKETKQIRDVKVIKLIRAQIMEKKLKLKSCIRVPDDMKDTVMKMVKGY